MKDDGTIQCRFFQPMNLFPGFMIIGITSTHSDNCYCGEWAGLNIDLVKVLIRNGRQHFKQVVFYAGDYDLCFRIAKPAIVFYYIWNSFYIYQPNKNNTFIIQLLGNKSVDRRLNDRLFY